MIRQLSGRVFVSPDQIHVSVTTCILKTIGQEKVYHPQLPVHRGRRLGMGVRGAASRLQGQMDMYK